MNFIQMSGHFSGLGRVEAVPAELDEDRPGVIQPFQAVFFKFPGPMKQPTAAGNREGAQLGDFGSQQKFNRKLVSDQLLENSAAIFEGIERFMEGGMVAAAGNRYFYHGFQDSPH